MEISQTPRELVRLRDKDKRWIDYQDTEQTRCMRRFLIRANEALKSIAIAYPGFDLGQPDRAFRVGNTMVYPQKVLYRVFNEDFCHGGRLYGGGWQWAPKLLRPRITIDGESTMEWDHKYLHPRLLYYFDGEPLDEDPYLHPSWDREIAKRGFNILLNARSYASALGAISALLEDNDQGRQASQLIADLRLKHNRISRHFHTGVGSRLQAIDANMAVMTMKPLFRKGVVVLPVHDSFIVQERHLGVLKEAMDAAYSCAVKTMVLS
jgi:hypothetical protein